jgi:protein gp37
MSQHTAIQWCDATWNPASGCTPISAGCMHCYAQRMAEKLRRRGTEKYRAGFAPTIHMDDLEEPKHWRKPRKVFVCSMGDLFHELIPTEFIQRVLETIEACPQHTFLLLTKRADRLAAIARPGVLPANAWAGVSVENRATLWRLERLRDAFVPLRFVSFEPLLEDVGPVNLTGIHWVIAGGETGIGARPLDTPVIEALLTRTKHYGLPFFFKQWGEAGSMTNYRPPQILGQIWREWPEAKA